MSALFHNTAFESLFKCKPDVRNLHVLGYNAFVHILKALRSKLGVSLKTILGYGHNTKGIRCFNLLTNKVIIIVDVAFHEDEPGQFLSPTPTTDIFG